MGNGRIRCPAGSLVDIPTITTPYPPITPLPGQGSPSNPLGCYGPDLSSVQKQYPTPILGKPRGSDPADPYNCSGGWIMPTGLASQLLALVPATPSPGSGSTGPGTGTGSGSGTTTPTVPTVPPVKATLPVVGPIGLP